MKERFFTYLFELFLICLTIGLVQFGFNTIIPKVLNIDAISTFQALGIIFIIYFYKNITAFLFSKEIKQFSFSNYKTDEKLKYLMTLTFGYLSFILLNVMDKFIVI